MSQRSPLHHVLSHKLVLASTSGITSDPMSPEAVTIMVVLDALHNGRMKTADAHMIGKLHAGLPNLLAAAGQETLAWLARQVIEDLQNREGNEQESA